MLRGEVRRLELEPTIGAEIRKTRPVIIINDNKIGVLPLKVIVPITDYKNVEWMTKSEPNRENGLSKLSAADAFQVRSVSQKRFVNKLGEITTEELEEITEALAIVLQIF